MATYSFLNVQATITGAGGNIDLASSGTAEESITIESTEDLNIMTTGASRGGAHSLVGPRPATITVRLLQTSPTNALLMQMCNLQTSSALLHGYNVITIRDTARGDVHICSLTAFQKRPTISYAKETAINEWVFSSLEWVEILGTGTPEA